MRTNTSFSAGALFALVAAVLLTTTIPVRAGLGGDFGEAPSLITAQPSDQATGVATVTPLMLIFSTSMAESRAIQWSANVDASKLAYSWGFGGMFLTITPSGGWPANATVTYTLNPPGTTSGFKDLLGVALPTTTGSFSTGAGGGGGGGTDPCQPVGGERISGFFMSKNYSYTQTSSSAPAIDKALFQAVLSSTDPITEATLRLPGGTSKTMTNVVGTFMHFEEFTSQTRLDAAYPSGAYTLTVKFQSGATQSGTLNYPANPSVTVPRIANFQQLASFAAAQPFTFQWDAFAAAGANDSIFFSIRDAQGKNFHAPDLCIPRELPVTATSIAVPANTLSANQGNSGSLNFTRIVAQNQNFTASLSGAAGFSRDTKFEFAASGSSALQPPRFTSWERSPAGVVTLRIAVQAGSKYAVEFSQDWKTWASIASGTAAAAEVTTTHTPSASIPAGYYRALALP